MTDNAINKAPEAVPRDSEHRYRELVEQASCAILRWTSNGIITFINTHAQTLFGWPAAEAVGRHVGILVPDQETTGTDLRALLQEIVAHPERYRNNLNENVCRDGRRLWMTWTNHALRDEQGRVTGILSIGNDVTELKRAEQAMQDSETRLLDVLARETAALRDREEQLRFVLEGADLGFWDWNIATGRVERNERWAGMLGYRLGDLERTDRQWTDLIHPEDRARAWDSIQAVLDGRAVMHKIEYRMLHREGSIRWILDQARVMQRDAAGKPVRMCGTHTDITERKRLESELWRQAHFDFLTRLCNRGYFVEQARREIALAQQAGRPLSLLLLDLDFFKDINDRHGHAAGDRVLRHLARLCRRVFRDLDIVGRLGGEEFAVLLPNASEREGLEAAERLRARVEETEVRIPRGAVIRFTVSIGVASCRDDGDQIDALLQAADTALYAAKRAGRNRVRAARPVLNNASM